jgi:hypothetical protein
VLASCRAQLAEGGTLPVMDEAADDILAAPSDDPVQRFFATVSVLWCLPQSRPASAADRSGRSCGHRLRKLAPEAGISTVTVLPNEHPLLRFHRLSA